MEQKQHSPLRPRLQNTRQDGADLEQRMHDMEDPRELETYDPKKLEQEDAEVLASAIQAEFEVEPVGSLAEDMEALEIEKATAESLRDEIIAMQRSHDAANYSTVTAAMVAKMDELRKERDEALIRVGLAECAHEAVFGLKKGLEIALECEKLTVKNLVHEKAEALKRLAAQADTERLYVKKLERENLEMLSRLSRQKRRSGVVRQTGSLFEREGRHTGGATGSSAVAGMQGRCEDSDGVDTKQPQGGAQAQFQRLWDKCEVLKMEATVEASKHREARGRLAIVTSQNAVLTEMCQKLEAECKLESQARSTAESNAEKAMSIMARMRDLWMACTQEGAGRPVEEPYLPPDGLFSAVDRLEIQTLGASQRERRRARSFADDMDELRERLAFTASAAMTTERVCTTNNAAGPVENGRKRSAGPPGPVVGAFRRVSGSPRSVSSRESDYHEAISTPESKLSGPSLTEYEQVSLPPALPRHVDVADGGLEEPEVVSPRATDDGAGLGGDSVLATRDVNVTSPARVVHSPPSRVPGSGGADAAPSAFVDGANGAVMCSDNRADVGHASDGESSDFIPPPSLLDDAEVKGDESQEGSVGTFSSHVKKSTTDDLSGVVAPKHACMEEAEMKVVDNDDAAIEMITAVCSADGVGDVAVGRGEEHDETEVFLSEEVGDWAGILAMCEHGESAVQRVVDLSLAVTVLGEEEFLALENTKVGATVFLSHVACLMLGCTLCRGCEK